MCHNPRIYFRLWLEHVLGFVKQSGSCRTRTRSLPAMGPWPRIRGGRASPRAARTCHKRRVYFRRWLEHVLGFVNIGSRGRDPSRRWAHGHVFGEGARPRAPRMGLRCEPSLALDLV